MTVEDPSALAPAEPLFTTARTYGLEPEVRLSLFETLMDSMGGPVVELGPAPVGFIQPPPATLGPRHASRKGMVRNFRDWWKQESLARAGQKRAAQEDEVSALARALEEMRGQISELVALQRNR